MSDYFVGQIMMTGFGFAPRGFALCNGQLLPISQNAALFSLLGTQYGGNGVSTFQLPDMRGRTPVGAGTSADPGWQPSPYSMGQSAGAETVTLTGQQLPAHFHSLGTNTGTGNTKTPAGALPGTSNNSSIPMYAPAGSNQVALYGPTLATAGGSQAHTNMQPFQTISFSIALSGIYPSRA